MKSTTNKPLVCDALWNERQAHFAMQQSKEQVARDRIADRNARTRLDEQLRKERLNERFWRNVWVSTNTLGLMIVIYMLFHFM
ncbi:MULTISPECIES: hypothetical protein [unclassified Psychrobacter]|uniref:hypothetical protein n=1 Tax=unclassified Psychrobacter TaxID=196806 RepID=UPI0025DC54EF|nr:MULTISPECIES: hypothetical protein [unclassified Psychrobacter]